MQDVIKLLPESLANQIAAGEVVQRPASAVKEMLENSIDSGATHITLVVKDAGKTLIQVSDDGCGMSATDARLAFERHATSKISRVDDLFALTTFGFRGEALASIAAVAQVEMRSKRRTDEMGTLIRIEGSDLKTQEPATCPDGTTLIVKNLFFNVPARRNFLKSNPVELKHIVDEFQRVALAYPDKGFSLYQDDLEIYALRPGGNLAKRVVGLLGKGYQEQLLPCREETDYVRVHGYIGRPEASKKTRGEQFLFVNDRFIRHPYLHHAIMSAYEGLLPDGHFPFYVIKMDMDPRQVDVNVHPTKTEVKFDDERTLYAVILAAARQALAGYGATPQIDFDLNVNFLQGNDTADAPPSDPTPRFSGQSGAFRPPLSPDEKRQASNVRHWENLYGQFDRQLDSQPQPDEAGTLAFTFSSAANDLGTPEAPISTPAQPQPPSNKVMQVRNKYILSLMKSGVMVIDQQAAHERVLYERFLREMEQRSGVAQRLLFPVGVTLSPADRALMLEIQPELEALGFLFGNGTKESVQVTGVPADFPNSLSEQSAIEDFLQQIKNQQATLGLDYAQRVARVMAKRTATREGQSLTNEEMIALIGQLFACSNPNYTADGRKTMSMIGFEALDELFM